MAAHQPPAIALRLALRLSRFDCNIGFKGLYSTTCHRTTKDSKSIKSFAKSMASVFMQKAIALDSRAHSLQSQHHFLFSEQRYNRRLVVDKFNAPDSAQGYTTISDIPSIRRDSLINRLHLFRQ